jgi:ankyrin repeat protein
MADQQPVQVEQDILDSLDGGTEPIPEDLMEAAYRNYLQVVRHLVEEKGISPNVRVTTTGASFPSTPLFAAVAGGAREVVVYLLETCGVDPQASDVCCSGGALKVATNKNDPFCFSLLLKHGADLNNTIHNGCTLLMYAATLGSKEIVEICLADPRCNLNQGNEDGMNALCFAMVAKCWGVVRQLLAHNAMPIYISPRGTIGTLNAFLDKNDTPIDIVQMIRPTLADFWRIDYLHGARLTLKRWQAKEVEERVCDEKEITPSAATPMPPMSDLCISLVKKREGEEEREEKEEELLGVLRYVLGVKDGQVGEEAKGGKNIGEKGEDNAAKESILDVHFVELLDMLAPLWLFADQNGVSRVKSITSYLLQ